MNALVTAADIPVTRICGQRDEAIRMMREAAALLGKGHAMAAEAQRMAAAAAEGTTFTLVDRRCDEAFRRLFVPFDETASVEVFRRTTDANVWMHLFQTTGLEHLMDATAREAFFNDLSTTVPEVNEANLHATLEGIRGDAKLVFQRGLARAFSDLDRRFKSHDAFKLGARVILTNVFDMWGSWNSYGKTRAMIFDVERVLALLDGKAPAPGELHAAIDACRAGGGMKRRQGVCETRYLRIRTFMNGNAHLWFTRDDLVEKANRVLADYYGEVLPDAAPRDVDRIRTKSGLPAKDLSFYPTPQPVVDELLRDLHLQDGASILEPSAGDGAIVVELLKRGYAVEAVEIDPVRVNHLSRIPNIDVRPGNFLRMPAQPVFDAVVMNPPFYGTHWIEHVVHAFDWLKPGGVLRAVLPATAEVGESAKHEAFRAWASKHTEWNRPLWFKQLPAESFASSGTRINTVVLELHRRNTT